MVPHREPTSIEISVILCEISCDSNVEPYIIKISTASHPPPPTTTTTKKNPSLNQGN